MANTSTPDKFLSKNATGAQVLKSAVNTGGTTAEAGKIPALGDNGKIDISMIPTESLMTTTTTFTAFENLTANSYVNFFSNAGSPAVQAADASATKPAHGYVTAAVTAGDNATVYVTGMCEGAGLAVGTRYFLSDSTPGGVTATPGMSSGKLIQFLGVAVPLAGGKVGIQFEYDDYILVE